MEVYRDKHLAWRWRLLAGNNGQEIADSPKGWTRKLDAAGSAQRVLKAAANADLLVMEAPRAVHVR